MSIARDHIRADKLRYLIDAATARGRDAMDAVRAELPELPDRDQPIGVLTAGRAFSALADAVPEDFGSEVGLGWDICNVGAMAYALVRSPTLGALMDRVARCSTLCGHPFTSSSTLRPDAWEIGITPDVPMSAAAERLCIEEAFASALPNWAAISGGRELPLIAVELTATRCSTHFGDVCASKIRLGAPRNRMILDPAARKLPISLSAVEIGKVATICEAALPPAFGVGDMFRDIVRLILARAGDIPSLGEVADHLGTSKRSLNRELQNLGISYQQFVCCYRLQLAAALIRCDTLSLKEIAHVVGYDNSNSLMRSFRKSHSETIGQWRRRAHGLDLASVH